MVPSSRCIVWGEGLRDWYSLPSIRTLPKSCLATGRTVKKYYHAQSEGVAVQDHYDIQVKIGPVPHPRLGTVYAVSHEGKAAQSIARVMDRGDASTLFEVELVTGRPHQIRIHLASIDHPLIGDPLYGRGGVPLPTDPGCLAISGIDFTHIVSNFRIRFLIS